MRCTEREYEVYSAIYNSVDSFSTLLQREDEISMKIQYELYILPCFIGSL